MRVSVVVPVYNPGPAIEPCIESLLQQDLGPEGLELIFVDDGSTDGTAARLDRLAAEQPSVRTLRVDRSGSPGRPRNAGLAHARGSYVTFVDADDQLLPGSLGPLVAFAERHRSEIATGLVVSAFRERPQHLFEDPIGRCTLRTEPRLIDMTAAPGKLFRTAFVRDAGITFPEGWRRGEDQRFTVAALVRATSVSVLPSPLYRYVERVEGGHLTDEPLEPTDLERVPEIARPILDGFGPGPLRDRLLGRFLRVEIIRALTEAFGDEGRSDPDLESLFQTARGAAAELGPGAEESLGPILRTQARLLRQGDRAGYASLAAGVRAIELRPRLNDARWLDGDLRIRWTAELWSGLDGAALTGRMRPSGPALVVPMPDGTAPVEIPVGEAVGRTRVRALLRGAATAIEVGDLESHGLSPGAPDPGSWPWRLSLDSTLPMPDVVRQGSLDRDWRLAAQVTAFGLTLRAAMATTEARLDLPALVEVSRSGPVTARARPDATRNLTIVLEPGRPAPGEPFRSTTATARLRRRLRRAIPAARRRVRNVARRVWWLLPASRARQIARGLGRLAGRRARHQPAGGTRRPRPDRPG